MASYTVKRGDTLSAIAKANNTTVKQLAKDNGISNPNYIEAGQKIQVPDKKPNSTTTVTPNTPENNGVMLISDADNKGTNQNNVPTINGVDQNTMNNGFNNQFQGSDDLNGLGDEVKDSYGNFKDLINGGFSIDQSTWDTLNTPFAPSDSYNQAMEFTNGLLAQLTSGRTSYTDQINDMMNKIMNREEFSYDVDKDQLFQQALSSAMRSGQSAMQDTIGQASALTGGYGSTYATSAGNQAYNAFIEDAYNNLPEYYQMAMEAYQMEGQEMYNQLGMLRDADNTEYQRTYNAWEASDRTAQNMWNREFNVWEAEGTRAYNSANLQLAERNQQVNEAFSLFDAGLSYYDSMYAKEWDSWNSEVQQAQQLASLLNSDWWSKTNFDESVRQFDETYNQTERWNQKDLDYKNATLNENKRQFNYSIGDTNNDGKVDENEKAALEAGLNDSDFTLTDTNITKCKEILNNGGTRDDVLDYLAVQGKIPSSEEDDAILDSVLGIKSDSASNGTSSAKKGKISIGEDGGGNDFAVTEGENFDVKVGDKKYRVENQGKVTDEKLVSKLKSVGANNEEVFVYEGDAYVKFQNAYYAIGSTEILWWGTDGYKKLINALR